MLSLVMRVAGVGVELGKGKVFAVSAPSARDAEPVVVERSCNRAARRMHSTRHGAAAPPCACRD